MEIILYCLAAFTIGFLIAWIIKKTPVGNLKEVENLRIQVATLEKEKQYLKSDTANFSIQITAKTKELQDAEKIIAEFTTRIEYFEKTVRTNKEQFDTLDAKLREAERELQRSEKDNHAFKTALRFKDEQLTTQKQELENIGKQFTKEFENLAQRVLDEKTNTFNKHQEKSLADILTPLKDNIQNFKTEFETKYKTESDDRISLREQIKYMMDINQTLSTQANNLTNALRGQVKQQGNWGEMILESILEYADLQKGIHYFVQERAEGEEGQALQPDVVVRYPNNRSIVIDSKVSLLHYEQYSTATEVEGQTLALNLLLQSTYRHIDNLGGKKYQDAIGALDFVMLFVPVEGAYITIMQADRELWQHAYKKRVLLISPTNLIAAMKLVYDMWKRDGINHNAQEIADKAVKIYEKLAAFVEDFEKIGAQLEKTTSTFKDAQKKLHTGRVNVINLASQMKQKILHNKPIRELPKEMIELSMVENAEENENIDDAEVGNSSNQKNK